MLIAVTIVPLPVGFSTTVCVPVLPHPTSRFPLAPSARPVGAQEVMPPIAAKLYVRSTTPLVLISCTPPASNPLKVGIETKKVPVLGFHTDCSMPPSGICPGIVMFGCTMVGVGGVAFMTVAKAGELALLATNSSLWVGS